MRWAFRLMKEIKKMGFHVAQDNFTISGLTIFYESMLHEDQWSFINPPYIIVKNDNCATGKLPYSIKTSSIGWD